MKKDRSVIPYFLFFITYAKKFNYFKFRNGKKVVK